MLVGVEEETRRSHSSGFGCFCLIRADVVFFVWENFTENGLSHGASYDKRRKEGSDGGKGCVVRA